LTLQVLCRQSFTLAIASESDQFLVGKFQLYQSLARHLAWREANLITKILTVEYKSNS
jgi:hypothetical protein